MTNLQPVFGNDWDRLLGHEFKAPYWQKLQRFVAAERSRFSVYPPHNEVFASLRLTSYKQTKVLILGQDPYHGAGQANGFCFSVRRGVPVPPSLRSIHRELRDDLGVPIPEHGSLEPWAHRGVLLLNATLTVRKGSPASHRSQGWEVFTDNVIEIVAGKPDRVVFILWGAVAQLKEGLIDRPRHTVIKSPHPSPQAAHKGFFGSRPFSRANDALIAVGQEGVDWSLTR